MTVLEQLDSIGTFNENTTQNNKSALAEEVVKINLNDEKQPRQSDYERLKVVGKGGYGKVYMVRRKTDSKVFAMKVAEIPTDAKDKEHLRCEKKVFELTLSPFLCKMFHHFKQNLKRYFVLEFLSGGDLFSLLNREKSLSEETARFYAAEVTLALEHLHSKNVIYRDLKANNVMITPNGHIKLTDFGSCKILEAGKKTSTFCGTLECIAPEMLNRLPYDFKVDFWAHGIFIYDMLYCGSPFQGKTRDETREKIRNLRLHVPENTSETCRELLVGLLNRVPFRRWSLQQVKNSRFFEGINWERVSALGYEPPFKPNVASDDDASQFEAIFTDLPVEQSPCKAVNPKSKQSDPFKNFDS